ncbi:alpha/beta hydrolase [Streptomyces sp. NPDC006184]|uniref:alpha/beta fold hydrolase n=1 Tax=Streptomyces sp. NPDC006184 TaxID=3155455 RepID=UPI0033B31066
MSRWDSQEFTAAAGTRVHSAALGPCDAPEVVCVHGLGCSYRYWLPFARALAPQARTVAVDLPGFGRTRGPDHALDVRQLSLALADWLRATGRGPTALVANSIGCQIVVDLAVHAPELVGPVVLNGPTFDPRARSLWAQAARLLRDAPWERPSLWPPLLTSYAECGVRRALHTCRYALRDPVEHKLHRLRTPVAVARGARDPVVPEAWAREVTALLPHGRLVTVPGAGHALNFSAPQELARITLDLLREGGPDEESGDAGAPP